MTHAVTARTMLRLLAVALLAFGCVPFALPPSRLSLGTGPVTGGVDRENDVLLRTKQVTSLRAGLHPLSALNRAAERPVDVGLGYQADFIAGSERPTQPVERRDSHDLAHGPYLEAAYYPLRPRVGEATYLRVGGRGNADLLFLEPDQRVGLGGSAAVELELVRDVTGPFVDAGDDGVVVGAQQGQWALGLFVGGTVRRFPDATYGGLTLGVSVRLPLAAGFACCAWPSKSDDESSREARRRAEPHASPPAAAPEPHRTKPFAEQVAASPRRKKARAR